MVSSPAKIALDGTSLLIATKPWSDFVTPHGFRAEALTLLDKELRYGVESIEYLP